MLQAALRPKVCAMCPREFIPRSSFHACCSQRCAMKKVAADKAKEREQTRARRRELETIPELIRAAQREFNAYIRERDKDKPCICCGRPLANEGAGGAFDCGHYRSVGSASHLRFNELNAHGQTKYCNRHGAGRAVDYRIGLIARIGVEAVEALEADNRIHRWTREELRSIRDTYRLKARALKAASKEEA